MQANNAAIYARISREDGFEQSKSIDSQIKSLNNYAKENNIKVEDIFIDDGYSGATLDRPDLKRLLSNIQLKKFNCILIKDLSRLGRNMIQVGNLLEEVFPKNNIRLIAVNDNYDSSSNTDDESVLLKSFLNDYYLKECSKKQRKAKKQKAQKHNMSTTGLYGYIKDENKQLIIDNDAALVVREIFDMYENNITPSLIAKHLSTKNIPTPAYNKVLNSNNKCYNVEESKKYNWSGRNIIYIISNYDYTGNSVNLKTVTLRGREVKNNNPIILENTHQAIITIDQFNKTKAIRESKTNNIISEELEHLRIKSLFKCNCGKTLLFEKGKKTNSYRCKRCNSYFNTNTLHEALSTDIKNLIKSFNLNQKQFETRLKQIISNTEDLNNIKELEKEKNYIQNQIEKLFESKIEDKINLEEYKIKNNELKESLLIINTELSKCDNIALDIKMFDNRLNKLKNEIKESANVSNDLDLIRYFIKECVVIKEEDLLRLKPKYRCGIRISLL